MKHMQHAMWMRSNVAGINWTEHHTYWGIGVMRDLVEILLLHLQLSGKELQTADYCRVMQSDCIAFLANKNGYAPYAPCMQFSNPIAAFNRRDFVHFTTSHSQ